MSLSSILLAAAVLGGLCVFFGALIAVADRRFRVEEDPRLEAVVGRLPGSNCGACGFAGCRSFAEGILAGKSQPAGCTQINAEGVAGIASYLGVEAGTAVKRVARLLCAGGHEAALQQAEYRGLLTCAAAHAVAGGGKACAWGCLGLADCQRACDYAAIRMDRNALPVVDPPACTACGDCVTACPRDLFVLMPVSQRLIVQCKSALEGDEALAVCRVACTACGKCAQDAAPGLIRMERGLAVIDYARNELAAPKATSRCPTGAIQWVDGAQAFGRLPKPAESVDA